MFLMDDDEDINSGKLGMLNKDNQETTDILDKRATKIFKRRNNI